MEEIEQELNEKSIEKSDNLDVKVEDVQEKKPKKTKKQRSQKQIESFEKARKIRAEKIAAKKKEKQEVKEEKKVKIKEFKQTLEQPLPQVPRQSEVSHYSPGDHYAPHPEQGRGHKKEQIVNNYFYYGIPPGAGHPQPRPATPPSPQVPRVPESSSEEEYYEEEPILQPPQPNYPKFNYV